MAETSKPARPRKKKAVAKSGARKPATKAAARKSAAKPAPARTRAAAGKRKAAPRPSSRRQETSGFDGLAKLIDHPLVADLLAVGAMAAVAAIADHNVKTRTGEAEAGSSKVVKAIGKRLMTEVDAVRDASKPRRG